MSPYVRSRIAGAICREVADVDDAECVVVSQIGDRIDDPVLVDIRLLTQAEPRAVDTSATEIVRSQLASLDALRSELVAESVTVF